MKLMSNIPHAFLIWLGMAMPLVAIGQKTDNPSMQRAITEFAHDTILSHATIGFHIMDVSSQKTLASYNPDISISPASTLKLITTATALEMFGKDYQFLTRIEYTGKLLSSGKLLGDLYITGQGDPTLGSKYFPSSKNLISQWVTKIEQKKITSIKGAIIADGSFLSREIPRTWIWEDIANYYGSTAQGLSYKDNTYSLYFESGTPGTPTNLTKTTPNPNLQFINKVISSSINRDQAYIFGSPESDTRIIKGSIPSNRNEFRVKGALPHPGLLLAQELRENMCNKGILTRGKAREIRTPNIPSGKKLLFVHKSPSLEKIVYLTNQKSINLYAQHLLKLLGRNAENHGTTEAGIKTIISYWKKQGINTSPLFLYDGCGLSRFNAVSARFLTQLLKHMYMGSNAVPFMSSLPKAGKTGTLKNFGKHTPLENNLIAKTGSMMGVKSYSGYLKTKKGNTIAFTLLINNYKGSSQKLSEKVEHLFIMILNS